MSSRRESFSSSPSEANSARASSRVTHLAREAARLGEDLAHLAFDLREVLGREGPLDLEVVLELLAVVGAADVDLRAGEEALHRVGHHVLGRVADHLARLRIAVRHDLERDVAPERRAQIDQPAVDATGERGLREPRTDLLAPPRARSRPRAPSSFRPSGNPTSTSLMNDGASAAAFGRLLLLALRPFLGRASGGNGRHGRARTADLRRVKAAL